MEIMISEHFENELSVIYEGTGYRVESCDVESIGGKLREITVILRKVEEPEPEEMSETFVSGYNQGVEDIKRGQDQQAAVDHTARQDCGTSSPESPYGPRKPYPASLRGNW